MKRLMTLVLACALCLTGCGRRKLYSLDEVRVLVLEKECSEQELAQVVSGRDRAEIVDAWGEPDLKLHEEEVWKLSGGVWLFLEYDEEQMVGNVMVCQMEIW